MRHGIVFGAIAIVVALAGCDRPKHYETTVEVTRMSAVRRNEVGRPLTLDMELSYTACPGTQVEVIRGDADFAACVGKYKVGDKVPVGIEHAWNSAGRYEWTVSKVGDCARVRDPNDEASYAMVRECEDWLVNGARVGFRCNYVPEEKLLDACPWFRRR